MMSAASGFPLTVLPFLAISHSATLTVTAGMNTQYYSKGDCIETADETPFRQGKYLIVKLESMGDYKAKRVFE